MPLLAILKSDSLEGMKSEFRIEPFHLGTRRVAEVVPRLGLLVQDQVVDTPYEHPSSPRAQGARFRPSRIGFRGFRALPGTQNPEFRIANEPLSLRVRKCPSIATKFLRAISYSPFARLGSQDS